MSQDKPGEDLGPEPSEQIASPDHDDPPPTATESYLHQVMSSSWVLTVGAILLAVLIGAILVIIADPRVAETASYFFARPTDFLGAAWDAASSAYVALFQVRSSTGKHRRWPGRSARSPRR